MTTEADKVMFEIYREVEYDRRYRVVYFTELSERNRDLEIGKAMAGEHLVDGYIEVARLAEAKLLIEKLLERLNNGGLVSRGEIKKALHGIRV